MRFSERYGHKPIREVIQLDSIDEALKNGIWSLLNAFYWDKAQYSTSTGYGDGGCSLLSGSNRDLKTLCDSLWFSYFKKPLDRLSDDWDKVLEQLRDYFFKAQWHEVYDFIEFIGSNFPHDYHETNKKFMSACNRIFEREMAAYRFVDGLITKIVEEEDIKSIEKAIDDSERLASKHLRRSLELLSDRSNPDYRNSVKESISAVERLASHTTGEERGTLGQLLKKLEGRVELHPALKSAFSSLYGWTSDDSGIRHALSEKETADFEDAKFMLVACSAFINYVEGKLKNSG